jgi:hypothetical protein
MNKAYCVKLLRPDGTFQFCYMNDLISEPTMVTTDLGWAERTATTLRETFAANTYAVVEFNH